MTRVKEKLFDLNVRPSKQRGQNFVIDPEVIAAIRDFGAPQATENLVEVGPGLGALTESLAQFPQLTLIEIEPKFCEELRSKFPHVNVIQADVREFDFASLGRDLVVFGNLPYVFSTDIVFQLLQYSKIIKRAVLLLQKEFCERLAADPGSRDYGRLSVACQIHAATRLGPVIAGNRFHPPTKVESQLIELRFRETPRVGPMELPWVEKVVKGSFLMRRKKIINSLKGAGFDNHELLHNAFIKANIDPGCRAETLSIEQFLALARALMPETAAVE